MRRQIAFCTWSALATAMLVLAGWTTSAEAQPSWNGLTWLQLNCADPTAGNDALNDHKGDYTDLQGTSGSAAIAYASDATYAYFRLNIMASAEGPGYQVCTSGVKNNHYKSFGWGVFLDLDEDVHNYEVAVLLSWTSKTALIVAPNTVRTDSPVDEYDATNQISNYNICTHTKAESSGSDHYLFFAVPMADLLTVARHVIPTLTELNGKFTIWAGTSQNGTSLNQETPATTICSPERRRSPEARCSRSSSGRSSRSRRRSRTGA